MANNVKMKHLILFFLEKAGGNMYLTKLLKLLYFADFHAYANNMEFITGTDYEAWKNGPVPAHVWRHFDNPAFYHHSSFDGIKSCKDGNGGNEISPGKMKFDPKPFTEEDLQSMGKVWEKYGPFNGTDLIKICHEDLPWKTANKHGDKFLDYSYACYAYTEEDDDESKFTSEDSHELNRSIDELGKLCTEKGITIGNLR